MNKGIVGLLLIIVLSYEGFSQQFSVILGRPTSSSVTLNVLFDSQSDLYFEYGSSKGNYGLTTSVIKSTANEPIETTIEGLQAGTHYYYRVRYRKSGESTYLASPDYTFSTQKGMGKSFRFTVESDPHPYDKKCYDPLWNIALQNQLRDSADFMIDMGDTFGDDHNPFTITNKEIQNLHINARSFFSKVCHSLPFFFCLGNHEGEGGYYLLQTPPNNLAIWETLWRKTYWPNPFPNDFYSGNNAEEGYGMGKPENYYAFTWGDALFVILDVYRYATANEKPQKWDFTIGKNQYDWLKKTLETSNAKYKMVFAHHILGQGRGGVELATLYEWGGNEQNGNNTFNTNRPGWGLPIHQLMKQNKVDIFFQGHDHLYVRQELDGIVYQSMPMPSDSSYKIGITDNGDAYLSGKKLGGSGHLRVTVTPGQLTVDFVSALLSKDETAGLKNGQVVDSYTIKKAATTSTNVEPQNAGNSLLIFPNPSHNRISVQVKSDSPVKSVFITDLKGNKILSLTPRTTSPGFEIDTSGLPSGVYLIHCITEKQAITGKWMVNHPD